MQCGTDIGCSSLDFALISRLNLKALQPQIYVIGDASLNDNVDISETLMEGRGEGRNVNVLRSVSMTSLATKDSEKETKIGNLVFNLKSSTNYRSFLVIYYYFSPTAKCALFNVRFKYQSSLNSPLILLSFVKTFNFENVSVERENNLYTKKLSNAGDGKVDICGKRSDFSAVSFVSSIGTLKNCSFKGWDER
jgi:hypothetical protein